MKIQKDSIEEIEDHFHKTLVENMISLFKEPLINKKHATLIHQNNILNCKNSSINCNYNNINVNFKYK